MEIIAVLTFAYSGLIILGSDMGWTYGLLPAKVVQSSRNETMSEWFRNAKYLFRDRGKILGDNSNEVEEELKKIDIWIDAGNGYELLLNNEATVFTYNASIPEEKSIEMIDNLKRKYSNSDGIYGIINSCMGEEYTYSIYDTLNLEIVQTWEVHADFLNDGWTITMCKLKFREN